MEDSVKVLEAMFNKAESDLDYIARKVDTECANLTENSTQINPAEVLKRLEEIKREYAGVVAEAAAIQQAQKDALVFFQGQLVEMVTALTHLQTQTPLEAAKSEEAAKLENLLGITLPSPHPNTQPDTQPSSQTGGQTTNQTSSQSGASAAQQKSSHQPQAAGEAAGIQEASPVEQTAYEKRVKATECVEVTEAEFKAVSQLTRGRVKLAEVNQTYRILWQHFKEEGNSEALNTQQMYKMGLRITGQTGEAKLKVLKALKLLSMTKKGEVKLL